MNERQKNRIKTGLQLCAALLGTVLSFVLAVIVSILNAKGSNEEDAPEFFANDSEGNLVSYKNGNYKIIGK